jgi:hypothetical protein
MTKRILPRLATCLVEPPTANASPGSEGQAVPTGAKTSDATLKEIMDLQSQYSDEVWKSENLAICSKSMYIDMANNFVRWIQGEFKPGGAGLKPRVRRRRSSEAS